MHSGGLAAGRAHPWEAVLVVEGWGRQRSAPSLCRVTTSHDLTAHLVILDAAFTQPLVPASCEQSSFGSPSNVQVTRAHDGKAACIWDDESTPRRQDALQQLFSNLLILKLVL